LASSLQQGRAVARHDESAAGVIDRGSEDVPVHGPGAAHQLRPGFQRVHVEQGRLDPARVQSLRSLQEPLGLVEEGESALRVLSPGGDRLVRKDRLRLVVDRERFGDGRARLDPAFRHPSADGGADGVGNGVGHVGHDRDPLRIRAPVDPTALMHLLAPLDELRGYHDRLPEPGQAAFDQRASLQCLDDAVVGRGAPSIGLDRGQGQNRERRDLSQPMHDGLGEIAGERRQVLV
jgi:hypothetical protein